MKHLIVQLEIPVCLRVLVDLFAMILTVASCLDLSSAILSAISTRDLRPRWAAWIFIAACSIEASSSMFASNLLLESQE